ncbi:hypothetical protein FHX42_002658 [Saccharopolyspora lacisalsi]|uniref:Uncharacterized protein n=1 Tax=Halosaccharopolyspora lacisalsi TaxID=1000566 RepID=A0A839E0P1_9PSEU|nr:hypothetical protein [Halosaccharopolyspora lacisalsi]MBA8825307.1 hypothetical protein [Halosaccharopolyspora lacisalsi]
MPIPDPWSTSGKESAESPQSAPNGAREHEPERDRARAREASPGPPGADGSGEVVPFPGTTSEQNTDSGSSKELRSTEDSSETAKGWRAAATVWAAEARETATRVVDGSVWRSRPPALRDIHIRAQRAEWAGDIPALRTAGVWFGYVSLALTAAGYGVLWVVGRPARLAVAALITVLIVVFAV